MSIISKTYNKYCIWFYTVILIHSSLYSQSITPIIGRYEKTTSLYYPYKNIRLAHISKVFLSKYSFPPYYEIGSLQNKYIAHNNVRQSFRRFYVSGIEYWKNKDYYYYEDDVEVVEYDDRGYITSRLYYYLRIRTSDNKLDTIQREKITYNYLDASTVIVNINIYPVLLSNSTASNNEEKTKQNFSYKYSYNLQGQLDTLFTLSENTAQNFLAFKYNDRSDLIYVFEATSAGVVPKHCFIYVDTITGFKDVSANYSFQSNSSPNDEKANKILSRYINNNNKYSQSTIIDTVDKQRKLVMLTSFDCNLVFCKETYNTTPNAYEYGVHTKISKIIKRKRMIIYSSEYSHSLNKTKLDVAGYFFYRSKYTNKYNIYRLYPDLAKTYNPQEEYQVEEHLSWYTTKRRLPVKMLNENKSILMEYKYKKY